MRNAECGMARRGRSKRPPTAQSGHRPSPETPHSAFRTPHSPAPPRPPAHPKRSPAPNRRGRAAVLVLRGRRGLGLVPREPPLPLVPLRNWTLAGEAGAVVRPAAPGFYHKPQQVRDLVDFVVQRVLDQLGLDINLVKRWEGK